MPVVVGFDGIADYQTAREQLARDRREPGPALDAPGVTDGADHAALLAKTGAERHGLRLRHPEGTPTSAGRCQGCQPLGNGNWQPPYAARGRTIALLRDYAETMGGFSPDNVGGVVDGGTHA